MILGRVLIVNNYTGSKALCDYGFERSSIFCIKGTSPLGKEALRKLLPAEAVIWALRAQRGKKSPKRVRGPGGLSARGGRKSPNRVEKESQ